LTKADAPPRTNGGASPRLSEAGVVKAARELISEVGVDGCTMRELSMRLGVALGATYHHVPNKDRLLALVGRDVYQEIADGIPPDGDWRTRLRAVIVRTVELFSQYPGLAAHVMTHGSDVQPEGPNQVIYAVLRDAGFTDTDAGELMGSLFLYVSGMCISEQSLAGTLPSSTSDLLGSQILRGGLRPVFEAGLDMLLDGAQGRLRE